ncbi:MAG: hypothetical protein HBSAPP03_07690 [Phycisphaerae bacterium]|nr:MAG: hypothetical protein HBSAPP03_07690 [Phycisphaerae bacterium]
MKILTLAAAAAGVFYWVEVFAQTLDLTGYWPGSGNTASHLHGLSANGSIAVGYSLGGYIPPIQNPGFTWTRAGGRFDFGLLPGMPPGTNAFGISGDGSVVVGEGEGGRAYRWDGAGTPQSLGVLQGYVYSRATSANHDGSVVVGFNTWQSDIAGQAFRWTSTTGMVGLGFTRPDHFYSEAAAISRDGSTIVGHSRGGAGINEAFVWTSTLGVQPLPGMDSTGEGRAYGTNYDGHIIVGDSRYGLGNRGAVMWIDGQVVPLGFAPGWFRGTAIAVNDSGSVIVGSLGAGPLTQTAAIWTPDRGGEPLSTYLAFHGIAVPGNVNLLTATCVSADGMTIGGYTESASGHQEGFVVTIPAPGAVTLVAPGVIAGLCRRRRIA